jgi:hypothetical protein
MTGTKGNLSAAELAIDSYMAELLQAFPEELPEESTTKVADEGVLVQGSGYYVFEVSGLQLAIAATRVGVEVVLPAVLHSSGEAAWQYGTMVAGQAITVVDVVCLVLPADLAPPDIPLAERGQRLLLLDEGDWAIAIEDAGEEVAIDINAVSWRGPAGRRPWLAGTQARKRCVLLDLDGIRELLKLPVHTRTDQ